MQLTDLPETFTLILTKMAGYLDTLGVVVPVSQFVGAGEIAWDGESLTVYFGAISQGLPGQPSGQAVIPQAAKFSIVAYVQLLREVATLGFAGVEAMGTASMPSTDELNFDGLQEAKDAACLLKAAMLMRSNGDVVDPSIDMVIGPVTVIGPQGGLVATRIEIEFPVAS